MSAVEPSPVLTDRGLTLLPWRDAPSLPGIRDDLVAASNDPEMVRWTTVPNPYTSEHADYFLETVPEGVSRWAYVVDDRYCGSIELRPGGVLGYNTAPWARGQRQPPARYDLSPPTRTPKVCGD